MKKTLKNKYFQYILVGIAFASLTIIPGVPASMITIVGSMIYLAIVGLGFNVLLGYSGQISLGHAAFMGVGAYISAYMTKVLELPFLLSVLIAVAVPFLIGLILGVVALRLEGTYLAIATLGLGEIIRLIFIEAEPFTGGFSGMTASYPVIFGHQFTKEEMYILMVVVLVILMILVYNFINSSTGRALSAMKNSQAAAQAMGINLFKYKLIAFSVSTMFAGVAGVLYVHFIKYSDPTVWTTVLSLDLIAIVVVGGIGTIGGSVVGAVVIKGLPEILKEVPLISEFAGSSLVIYGVLVVVIVMFYTKGLIHLPNSIMHLIGRVRPKKESIEEMIK